MRRSNDTDTYFPHTSCGLTNVSTYAWMHTLVYMNAYISVKPPVNTFVVLQVRIYNNNLII